MNGTTDAAGRYVSWAPSPCSLRVVDPDGATTSVSVRVGSPAANGGGQLLFRRELADDPQSDVALSLESDGTPVDFSVAGRFGFPSTEDGDTAIEIRDEGNHPLGSVPLMVRVRKDANTLTDNERDRFLNAIALLNDSGRGVYQDFRAAHRDATVQEAHGRAGFLPWHRAYLLDLERELQAVDPSVALPYWRFDRPAPHLFRTDFMGESGPSTGVVRLTATNPLRLWTTDGQLGIVRFPLFDTETSAAHDDNGQGVAGELTITGFEGDMAQLPEPCEQDPHGSAHVSFAGFVGVIDTAARDPLFFLLHCNVDRLWAKWQWFQGRFDLTKVATFPFLGCATDPDATRVGHNLLDTMWPWNGDTTTPRPSVLPRQAFPESPVTQAPGATPAVGAMIDYQGHGDPRRRLGFDYDDVPFEPEPP